MVNNKNVIFMIAIANGILTLGRGFSASFFLFNEGTRGHDSPEAFSYFFSAEYTYVPPAL